MNCDDVQKALYVYLDGEFAEPERSLFERHLDGCRRCRFAVERERRFILSVKEQVPRFEAPAHLEAKIRAAIAATPVSPALVQRMSGAPRGRTTLLLVAVALLVVGGGLAFYTASSEGPADKVADEAVLTHQQDLPMEVRGSPRQIREFLEANVPFEVVLPTMGEAEVELIGARLTRFEGRDAVLLNYEVDGERLSVLQFSPSEVGSQSESGPPAYEQRAGFQVATFRTRGVTASVVGSGRTSGVERIVRAAMSY
jgi:anti-sigma factor RsiW